MQRALVVEQVLEKHPQASIVTNEVQKRLLQYYSGFDEDQLQRFLSYEEFEAKPERIGDLLLLQNRHTRYLSGMDHNDLPVWAREIPAEIHALFRSKKPHMALYDMRDLPLLDQEKILLFSSLNDFEKPESFWMQQEKDLSREVTYAGSRSNRIQEFSSTFAYAMDSLMLESGQKLQVSCDLFCLAEEETDARIVVSLEDESGAFFWEAMEVNRYLKAYSNWWPVTLTVLIGQEDVKARTNLKVYVWKTDNSEVYIDNFRVRITAFCE
jgi:hypothetical protein